MVFKSQILHDVATWIIDNFQQGQISVLVSF